VATRGCFFALREALISAAWKLRSLRMTRKYLTHSGNS
jgi:hypothetical protein